MKLQHLNAGHCRANCKGTPLFVNSEHENDQTKSFNDEECD